MKVGDIVTPCSKTVLACGSGSYPCAIVVSVEPFILVSEEADMLWSKTVELENFIVRGQADEVMLKRCMDRLYRDYPNHKLHQFMDTKVDET